MKTKYNFIHLNRLEAIRDNNYTSWDGYTSYSPVDIESAILVKYDKIKENIRKLVKNNIFLSEETIGMIEKDLERGLCRK